MRIKEESQEEQDLVPGYVDIGRSRLHKKYAILKVVSPPSVVRRCMDVPCAVVAHRRAGEMRASIVAPARAGERFWGYSFSWFYSIRLRLMCKKLQK